MHELNLLGLTRCAVCNGYGHTDKICPTRKKLKSLSMAGVTATIMKESIRRARNEGSRANKGEVALWSCLPVMGHKKVK